MVEFDVFTACGWISSRHPFSSSDQHLTLEMREEFEGFLLLMRANDLKLITEKGLELFLQAERECEPAHVACVTTLPKVHDALEVFFKIVFFDCGLDRNPVP